MQNNDITAFISTRGRSMSTLPHTVMSICNQTTKPASLIILDDDFRDLRGEFIWKHLFSLLQFYGINWVHDPGSRTGQVVNHIRSLEMAKTDFIFRCDDDVVLEPDCLEKLAKHIGDKVGAIAPLVIQSDSIKPLPKTASNKIEDIYLCQNIQWYLHSNNAMPIEVDHLYSTFLYRKDIAKYCVDLSPKGHREESLLTFQMARDGYKLIVEPKAKCWHWRNPVGGIRSNNDIEDFGKDERVFIKKLQEWKITPNEYQHVVLDNGIGDHYCFKHGLDEYIEINCNKKIVLYVTFPDVFHDYKDKVILASIADAHITMGDAIHSHNIYGYMKDHKGETNLCAAFRGRYGIPKAHYKGQITSRGVGSVIYISPYSQSEVHPKSYPYWKELVPKLKTLGYKLVQIGKGSELWLEGMDEYLFNLKMFELEIIFSGVNMRAWIAVDNFVQHMVNCQSKIIPGIVLWGVSDPKIFGYPYNMNIIKDRKYLRDNQFWIWYSEDEKTKVRTPLPRNNESFLEPDKVFEIIIKFLGGS